MKNIIRIIGKFNVAFLAIIVALYIACLALILYAVNPKHNYDIEPNYNHVTSYQEVSNSFQVIFRQSKSGNDLVETYSYIIELKGRTSSEDKTDPRFTIVKYQSEYKQQGLNNYYFSDVANTSTTWSKNTYVGEGHQPHKFYGKLKYIDTNNEEKISTFKEEIFGVPKSFDDYSNGNKIKIQDAEFTYQVVKVDQDNDHIVKMRVVSSTNRFFHMDLQTWILCEDGKVYPFVGAYGIGATWNVVSERVIGELKAKTLYCKATCCFNDEVFEMHYKANFSDMKDEYGLFENVDATKIEVKSASEINKYISFIIAGSVLATVATVITIGLVKSKKNKKTNNEKD